MESDLDAAADAPDEFDIAGYRVRWCGWRQPFNQILLFGVWAAMPKDYAMNITGLSEAEVVDRSVRAWVSCTLGATHQYRAFEQFDTTYSPEHGTKLMPWASEEEKLVAKRRAMKQLVISLKTGHPFGRVYGEWPR